MTVHDLARRAGIAAHVVRYYTQRGLLHPKRHARNGYRQYAEADLHRLRFVRRARSVGFSLIDIESILRDADGSAGPCAEVQQLIQRRLAEHEQRVAAAQRLQQRIREAVCVWEETGDQPLDQESLRRLIEAIALDENDQSVGDAVSV